MKLVRLNPWYVTGLVDAEGCFSILVRLRKVGWRAELIFTLLQANNGPNSLLMFSLREFFEGEGRINEVRREGVIKYLEYQVTGLAGLIKVRDHFRAYPLQSVKVIYFDMWCLALDIILRGEHLTQAGLNRIIGLKAHFPQGLSLKLTEAFPDLVIYPCPVRIFNEGSYNPHWIAGFVNGDGSFNIGYQTNHRLKLGATCVPSFRITQHVRDELLLRRIMLSFPSSYLAPAYSGRDRCNFNMGDVGNLFTYVVPFFTNYPLLGSKALDFRDWVIGINLIHRGGRSNPQTLALLKDLYHGMNSFRTNFD